MPLSDPGLETKVETVGLWSSLGASDLGVDPRMCPLSTVSPSLDARSAAGAHGRTKQMEVPELCSADSYAALARKFVRRNGPSLGSGG